MDPQALEQLEQLSWVQSLFVPIRKAKIITSFNLTACW